MSLNDNQSVFYATGGVPGVAVASGAVSNVSNINKFGRNTVIGTTSAYKEIWDGGTLPWVPPTTARTHAIASSSEADKAAGTGALTVVVQGLDANYIAQEETVTLNGTAGTTTTNSYTNIHRMYVNSAGAGAINVGSITAVATTDNTTTAAITGGNNQTLMAIYQVPAGKTGYLHSWYYSVNKNVQSGAVDIRLLVKPSGEVYQVKSHLGAMGDGSSLHQHKFSVPLKVEAKSIVKIGAIASAANHDVSAGFDMVLVNS